MEIHELLGGCILIDLIYWVFFRNSDGNDDRTYTDQEIKDSFRNTTARKNPIDYENYQPSSIWDSIGGPPDDEDE